MISIFGSPYSTRLFFQDSNSQTFCLPKFYAGTTMMNTWSPEKDDRIKFCHQQQVCQNLYIQWWKHTRGETLKNTREESNSTLNDANNKHEQLTMPVRSHRYCQNYNLNHFLSNKRIWIRYHLCWSLFHVVQPHALEKQSQLWKRICQKVNF